MHHHKLDAFSDIEEIQRFLRLMLAMRYDL